ncbi:Cytoplasmic tRNA 2-thiolation protein 2 [Zostera marina]|uniref:Cytoplasmic tRNA 2-thiolation protein 2 n=1 Tax=Zostera marina TaxID=29655 RepID=A0A0K9NL86_ZOSMR|nr:Cytoplasmic tRNA 2-thiolation protein 2 [Zostera marina]
MASSCGGSGGGGGGCGSQCSSLRDSPSVVGEEGNEILEVVENASVSNGHRSILRCSKCGEETAVYNKLCLDCFRSFLYNKFKVSVTSNAMISPVDCVLVAFSGGPASRVALQFTHEMQLKSQKNWDASKDQQQPLPVFGVGVAFIDERAFYSANNSEIDEAIEEIRLTVSTLFPPAKQLYVEPIEKLFSLDLIEGKARLRKLLDTIDDPTGKDDFLHYLRAISLQKVASENGFNKIILGSCTNGIACHIISSTVKGQGYSLPADVQYIDGRWDVPVVLPLRDFVARDLIMFCHLDRLRTCQIFHQSECGINYLVSSFLTRLQEENPARVRTIVRTAEKLSPFGFNKYKEYISDDMVPSRLRSKVQNLRASESAPLETLCPICGTPLCDSDLVNLKNRKCQVECDVFVSYCCASCRYQIVPKEEDSFNNFYSLLPQLFTRRVKNGLHVDHNQLREQVEEFLLSDDDEECGDTA